MENLIELNSQELTNINGGATFAYRVGEAIRFLGLATLNGAETAFDMVYF
jgi:hypothetical protein